MRERSLGGEEDDQTTDTYVGVDYIGEHPVRDMSECQVSKKDTDCQTSQCIEIGGSYCRSQISVHCANCKHCDIGDDGIGLDHTHIVILVWF